MKEHPETPRRFRELLKRVAGVPKREIDEQEARYKRERARAKPTKPAKSGQIVPAQEPFSR